MRLKPKEKERKKRSDLNGTNRFLGGEIDLNVRHQGKIRKKLFNGTGQDEKRIIDTAWIKGMGARERTD